MIAFSIPWPPRQLSPNARPHWAAKAKHVKSYRRTANLLLRDAQAKTPGSTLGAGAIHLTYTFCPPTRRAFDLDNMLSSCKAATDGIAEALCVNDSTFQFHIERGEVVKGGEVRVRLTWQP